MRTPDEVARHVCDYCGKTFVPKHYAARRQSFCSNTCSARAKTGRDYSPRTCLACGQPFAWKRDDQVYCSKACKIAHQQRKRDERLASLPRATCQECGTEFVVGLRDRRVKGAFCSRQCVMRFEGRKTGDRLRGKPGRSPSEATRRKMSAIGRARWAAMPEAERETYCAARSEAWKTAPLSEKQRATFLANQQKLPADRFGRTTCLYCGKGFVRKRPKQDYCSRVCGRTAYLESAGGFIPSSIELRVHNILDALGITYQTQVTIGHYFADVFIPDRNLVLDVQGCYWHSCQACGYNNPQKRAHDKRRATYMRNHGYERAEVWEHDINADVERAVRMALGI